LRERKRERDKEIESKNDILRERARGRELEGEI
jgi:hypothetical protein